MHACNKWIGASALALFCRTIDAQEVRDVAPPMAVPASAAAQPELNGVVAALSALLKDRLVQALPAQLEFEKETNWGHQAQIPSIQGITPNYVRRNHGNWEKARVIARDVPHRLAVNIGWLSSTAQDRIRLNVHLALPADLEIRQQTWQNGLQVYTSHLRSRFQLSAHLTMEAELQPAADGTVNAGKGVRLVLVRGTYACDHFVAENVNGVGGDLARWLDTGAGRGFKPWQPAVLNEFQGKIALAVASAGAGHEVQTCLGKLLLQSNLVRSTSPQPQPTVLLLAQECAAPRPAPVFFNGSIGVEVSNVARVHVPHVEHVANPALANFAIHVAHAAIVAATHIHPEPEHKK